MNKLQKTIYINAPVVKVWDTMLSDKTYRQWTAAFHEGSYFVGNWEEGSEILFLGPNSDGSGEGGMLSRIAKNRPHEFISIEHVGLINNGVRDTISDEVKKWVPAFENYTFTPKDGGTELTIDMDIADEHAPMFETMWAGALVELKKISEIK